MARARAQRRRSQGARELSRRASGRGLIAALAGAALAIGAPAVVAGQSGAPGVGDPFFAQAGNGGYDVASYSVALRYEARSGRIRARTALRARALGSEPLRRFNLDLRGLNVLGVRVDGRRARFRRRGPEIVVRPALAPAPGARMRVAVRYAGRPRSLSSAGGGREGWIGTGDGAVALGEPIGSSTWFPGSHHPSDKARFRVRVATPRRLVGISNGSLVASRARAGLRRTSWRMRRPMAPYAATVAIGRFRLDRAGGAPRYLAALDTRVPRRAGRRVREQTRRALRFMAGVAGPYPFGQTGAIVDPAAVGYALETQTRPFYPGPPPVPLVVHEVAHEWYGNSVTPLLWDDIWLNEGFATYMEWLYAERRGGRSAAARFDSRYAEHGAGDEGFWNPPPAAVPGPARMFATSVYQRGAMALQVLREEVGDADFFEILRRWATENRYGNVTTEDFRTLVATVTAQPVPALFDEWLTQPGKPPAP